MFSWTSCFDREAVKKQAVDLICSAYRQMYDAINTPANEYREPGSIVPRTPDQVVKLLSWMWQTF